MNSEAKRIRNKKIIIAALCVVIVALVIFGLTLTKYESDDLDGHAQYEPALFNTVLLGKLIDADVQTITSSQPYTVTVYTCTNPTCGAHISYGSNAILETCTVCPYCGQTNPYIDGDGEHPFEVQTYTQSLNGGKISKNLDLSEQIEFGKLDDNNVLKVAPGTEEKNFGHVFFTVTNGTTVEDVYTTPEEGEVATKTAQVANVAESDIRYKLHIITSNNLPLKYYLKDINTNTTYKLTDSLEKKIVTEVEAKDGKPAHTITTYEKQAASDYVVDTSTAVTATDFVNGTRILKLIDDKTITVHQYELIIKWPTSTTIKETVYEDGTPTEVETQLNNDSAYMKELENIQVLLEIESYVNYLDEKTSDFQTEGIIYLNSSAINDGFYSLKKASGTQTLESGETVTSYANIPFFGKKTARFDAFVEANEDEIKGIADTELYSNNYKYPLHIYNTNKIEATWVADNPNMKTYIDPLTGKSITRKENGQVNANGNSLENGQVDASGNSLKDGHYEYKAVAEENKGTGAYNMVIAVPSGGFRMNKSMLDWGSNDNKYYIVYNGETYVGVKSGEVVRSMTQTYNDTRVARFEEEDVTQYIGYRFYKTVTPEEGDPYQVELSLNFDSGTIQKEDVVLYRSSNSAYVSCKDDYRIYLVKPSN